MDETQLFQSAGLSSGVLVFIAIVYKAIQYCRNKSLQSSCSDGNFQINIEQLKQIVENQLKQQDTNNNTNERENV